MKATRIQAGEIEDSAWVQGNGKKIWYLRPLQRLPI